MNFINLISLFVLVTVFCSVRSENLEKTCVFGGYAGGFNFEDGIKSEDSEPFNNKEYMLKIKKHCPNLSSDRLACCYQNQMSNILFPIIFLSKTDRQECHDSFRDLLCEINCNPNQNKYVDVLEKKKSQLFDGKYFAKKISAKIDLKSANKYYENCKDAKVFGQTIYEAFGKPKSAPCLFVKFTNDMYKIDYR